MKNKLSLLNSIAAAAMLIALSWPLFISLKHSLTQAPCFHITDDEALHAEIIENLMQTGKYKRWSGQPFAPELTTGPTVLLPAALLGKMTNMSSAMSGRAIILLYHFLTLLMLAQLTWRVARKNDFNIAGSLVLIASTLGIFHLCWRGLQDTHYYNFGILGEGAGVFYLLITLLSTNRNRFFQAGFFASLAVLSKPYMLFLPISLVLYAFYLTFKRKDWLLPLFAIEGIMIPWLAWVGWMTFEIGLISTVEYWLRYPVIMRHVNGAGLPETLNFSAHQILSQISAHIKALPTLMKWRSILLCSAGLVFSASIPTQLHRFLIIFTALHLGWWLTLSPGAQSRYLLPVIFCAIIGVLSLFLQIASKELKNIFPGLLKPKTAIICLTFATLFIYFGLQIEKTRADWSDYSKCGLTRQLMMQRFWNDLPEHPRIWSTSAGYTGDLDLMLTAPYSSTCFDPKTPDILPADSWVSIGENPKEGALELLKKRDCKPVFAIPGSNVGFWKCR